MILTRTEYTPLDEFIAENAGTKLGLNAICAWIVYKTSEDETDYVVIRINNFYCITKIIDEWTPIEVSELVQPFNEKRTFPLKRVTKKITWDN